MWGVVEKTQRKLVIANVCMKTQWDSEDSDGAGPGMEVNQTWSHIQSGRGLRRRSLISFHSLGDFRRVFNKRELFEPFSEWSMNPVLSQQIKEQTSWRNSCLNKPGSMISTFTHKVNIGGVEGRGLSSLLSRPLLAKRGRTGTGAKIVCRQHSSFRSSVALTLRMCPWV